MHAGIRSGIYNLTPTPLLHERELEDLREDYVFQKKILFALLMNKWFLAICKNILFGYIQCTTSSLKERRKGGRLYRRSQPY